VTPWIQFGSLLVAIFVAFWTISNSHRKDARAKERVIWERIDGFRRELQLAKDELLVLKGEVKSMPSRDVLDDRMDSLEAKLEKKLDDLAGQMRELLKAALDRS